MGRLLARHLISHPWVSSEAHAASIWTVAWRILSCAINVLMLIHLLNGRAPSNLQPFVVLNLVVALLALAS